jgi:hypothetical protein
VKYNYIPSVDKKVFFDIKGKTFFLKNKDEDHQNEDYIKSFFDHSNNNIPQRAK